MNKLPEIGLYVSKDKNNPVQIYVEDSFGDDPEEFYFVEIIDGGSKDDPAAMGDELDNKQWESLVKKLNLEFQG